MKTSTLDSSSFPLQLELADQRSLIEDSESHNSWLIKDDGKGKVRFLGMRMSPAWAMITEWAIILIAGVHLVLAILRYVVYK